jgi:hypothetical protein
VNATAHLSPVDVAQGQLEAYNAQDLDAFCTFYADEVVVADLNGAISNQGLASLRDRYAAMFAQFPQNKVELKNRVAVGNTVIDHELVIRAPGGDRFEVAAIYTIANGKIVRVDFVK